MPTYSYTCKCGKTSEKYFSIHKDKPASVKCECGKRAKHDFMADHSTFKHGASYRVESLALGVDPEDLAKTAAEDKAMGSEASEWVVEGDVAKPVFTSLEQHRKYYEIRGYVDKDAFY